ncbi:MAG: 3-hydroxyacyl-CoA dehydrogenase NAD-binding domain-containing protein [Polaromonas sp.]|uniref:3-hydroxyacyl-CoA dehydrogenase NAD-binding domain-containing protein n=1 Tax=Polaromonas sp. TaxID=1869339 RepID=UPI00273399C4|nr:3-hydroxyacyl-CoA dehydrogenase NAD-binding domain-containing protein [Polaromonas sp.]MDP3798450.1 3-hydroxyacyl-CoA dehydrogenase NAD-binding domain-containing protein [Polaromonas sp.]
MKETRMPMVGTEQLGDVLLIEINNPPINAGSLTVRQGLSAAIAQLQAQPELRAGVIIGGGTTFVAGSDLREFGQPLQDPQMPAVIARIEACSKPIVAALHGAALGGGLELALACDARIALAGTLLGLPEVTLGIIPGAGGTQRLPRRVGVARAIQMVCSGERITADKALALRLVDEVVAGDLQAHAMALAQRLAGRKCRIRDESVAPEDAAAIELAEQTALRAGKRRPAVLAAIEAVKNAARLPMDEGLAQERSVFQLLRVSTEAFALRHQFFAEREAAKLPAALQAAPRPVQTVAVIGAGTMGSGIAICALDAGLNVILLEQDEAALQRGQQRVAEHYQSRVAAGKVQAAVAAASEARLSPTTDWVQLGRADLVIEAVFEDMAVKQDVFREIDAHARPGAVLATNTSYLDVDAIASLTTRPQDVLGLHFFSPAHVMKLLEVVRGKQTAADVVATGMALGKKLKKLPVLCGNAFGFIGNRLYNAYRKQCEFMLEDGAWPEDVDQALTDFGFAMGPFAVADLSGLDIAWRMRKAQAATRDPRERYVAILDQLCEQGRLGRKSGAGYYSYPDGKQVKTTDALVRGIIEQASRQRGITRRALDATEIQRRALLAMVNEAALLLAAGVASRASDIDVVLVLGYGFPRWEGGPVFWARQQDRAQLAQDLQRLAPESGHGFVVADLSVLLNP